MLRDTRASVGGGSPGLSGDKLVASFPVNSLNKDSTHHKFSEIFIAPLITSPL